MTEQTEQTKEKRGKGRPKNKEKTYGVTLRLTRDQLDAIDKLKALDNGMDRILTERRAAVTFPGFGDGSIPDGTIPKTPFFRTRSEWVVNQTLNVHPCHWSDPSNVLHMIGEGYLGVGNLGDPVTGVTLLEDAGAVVDSIAECVVSVSCSKDADTRRYLCAKWHYCFSQLGQLATAYSRLLAMLCDCSEADREWVADSYLISQWARDHGEKFLATGKVLTKSKAPNPPKD